MFTGSFIRSRSICFAKFAIIAKKDMKSLQNDLMITYVKSLGMGQNEREERFT
jgi:hypothetical protein